MALHAKVTYVSVNGHHCVLSIEKVFNGFVSETSGFIKMEEERGFEVGDEVELDATRYYTIDRTTKRGDKITWLRLE